MYHFNQNRFLAALPSNELASLTGHLELVDLKVGQMLYQPGQEIHFAYFPISCLISLQHVLGCGRVAEAAGVGKEGVVGTVLLMGSDSTTSSAVVQISGYAYQLGSVYLKEAFKNSAEFKRLILLYIQALVTQISLTAVCNRHHSLQQQLCKFQCKNAPDLLGICV